MMKRLLINILMVTFGSLAALGQSTHHEFKVGDFSRLSLIDDINVNYRCNADSAGLVVTEASQQLLDHILFTVSSSGRLSIQVDDTFERNGHLPTLTVYSSRLDEAENSGDSILRLSNLPPMKAFKVRNIDNGKIIIGDVRASKLELQILSGRGKIIASGSCDELALRLVGTGEIQADRVHAGMATCRIMGTGTIGCWVDGGELKVSGSGTGKVYYKGTPTKVTVRKLGTIKAIPMQ